MTDQIDPNGDTARTELDPTASAASPGAPLTPADRPVPMPIGYGHEVAWAPAVPVAPVVTTSRAPRRGRLRWAAAMAVVAVIIVTSVAAAALITGRSSQAAVLGYVPEQTTMYGEVRLDLPGDQRLAVGAFLSKFPGFADQAALDSKLDEVLDDLVKGASNGDQTYGANIKPWFDGELAFSVGPLPAPSTILGDTPSMSGVRALALMSVKDPVAAQAWIDAAVTKSGAKTTSETYAGASLTVFSETGGAKAAFALLDGKVAVLGDLVSVKAAVDTKGESGFAKEPGPKAAFDAASRDYVGFVYVALRPLLDWSTELSKSMATQLGGATATSALSDSMLKVLPEWGAYWLRFESDAVVMEAASPRSDTAVGPTEGRTSKVIDHIPSSALVASISNDSGKTLTQTLDLYRKDASLKPALDQVDQALALVGGADVAFGWAGDTAIVIDAAGGTPQGGLIVVPTDKAAADRLFTALRAFIGIGGAQQGITVHDETYNGTTITIVDLGDIGKLAGKAGMAGSAASGLTTLPTGQVEIAFAVTDDVVVVGSGPGFVKGVIDTTRATSLGASERYVKLAGRAGSGTGSTFVDITAIRELVEKAAAGKADPAAYARYQKEFKPFLVPFDAMIASGSISGDLSRSVIYVTVK